MNLYFTFLVCSALTCPTLFTSSAFTVESDPRPLEEDKKLEKVQHLSEFCQAASYSNTLSAIREFYLEVSISCKNEDKNRYKIYENSISTNIIEKFRRHGIKVRPSPIFFCPESYMGHITIHLDLLPHGTVQYTSEGAVYSSYLFLAHMSLIQKAFFETRDLDSSNYRLLFNPFCVTKREASYGIDQDPIMHFRKLADYWVDNFITDYNNYQPKAKG